LAQERGRLGVSVGNARAGFRITIFDNRTRGDNLKPRLERVVVAGSEGCREVWCTGQTVSKPLSFKDAEHFLNAKPAATFAENALERDEERCEEVFRSHPALSY